MGLEPYINLVFLIFIAMTHTIVQKLGYIYSAWIITFSLLVDTVLLNVHYSHFPRLKYFRLRVHIKRVVNTFSALPIKRVCLYNCQPLYNFNIPSFYAVVFELSPVPENIWDRYEYLGNTLGGLWTQTDIKDFDQIGLNESFIDVYKDRPTNDDYMKEWRFHSKILGNPEDDKTIEGMKILTQEPYWVLFPKWKF